MEGRMPCGAIVRQSCSQSQEKKTLRTKAIAKRGGALSGFKNRLLPLNMLGKTDKSIYGLRADAELSKSF